MADNDNLPKVDRRGTSFMVPLGIGVVLAVIAALMLFRNSGDTSHLPTPSGGAITQPSSK